MIAVVIFIVIGALTLAAIVRLIWGVSRGDMQIESTSRGRQLFGRSEKERD